jgi:hypothetical protein
MTTPPNNETKCEMMAYPLPWAVEPAHFFNDGDDSIIWVCVISDARKWLVTRVGGSTKEEAESLAAYIVARVNFCDGVANEDLSPASATGYTAKMLIESAAYYEQQLSDLRAELERTKEERNRLGKFKGSPTPDGPSDECGGLGELMK